MRLITLHLLILHSAIELRVAHIQTEICRR